MKKQLWAMAAGLCLCSTLWAQDMHFSQFYNAPFLLNPALAGMIDRNGDLRAIAKYRNQWADVIPYNSFAVGYDMRHRPRRCDRNYFFAHGLVFYYDQAGDTRYYHTTVQAMLSFTHRLGKKFYGSAGVKLGPAFEGFHRNQVTTANQFDPSLGQFDPTRSTGEENNLRTDNLTVFDLSAGLNFRYQKLDNAALIDSNQQRTRLDFGIGFFHINNPQQSFTGNNDNGHNLNLRISPYIIYFQQLGSQSAQEKGLGWDLLLAYRTQFQRPAIENNLTVGAKIYLQSRHPGSTAIMPALTGRFNNGLESIIPGLELYLGAFRFSVSHDITLSDSRNNVGQNGAWMFYFSYIFKRVKIPCKNACPVL